MSSERKKLYLYAGINFLLGIIVGIVLFYGQLRNNPDVFPAGYSYDKTVETADVLRIWWLNIMWLFAAFITHCILPIQPFHLIVWVRGCASSFSLMYILSYLGIKEALASALPQCVSVLPLLLWFSVAAAQKCKMLHREGRESFSLKRSETIMIFVFSLLAAAAEVIFFRLLCYCLF